MTVRAIVLGIAGAVFIPTVGYFSDHVAHLNRFVAGQFPIMTYGPLVLVVLFINPLIGRFRPGWRLRRAELAVVIMGGLIGASLANNGLLRYFTRLLVMPIQMNETEPGWKEAGVLDDVPDVLLANRGQYDETLTLGFINGMGTESKPIGLADVPWHMWSESLLVWGVLILLFALASICVALIVHPQWSRRELLRYPIAEFARALMGSSESGDARPVYRRPGFVTGATALFLYHVINGCYEWWPDYTVRIPLRFDFTAMRELLPWFDYGWSHAIYYPAIWPTAVALAFFLAKDVTFSVGISQPLATALGAALVTTGVITPGGNFITGNAFHWQRAASCLALVLMLLYFGRHYYRRVAVCALTFRPAPDDTESSAIAACRILFLCLAVLVAVLVFVVDLDWPLALAFVAMVLVAYVCVARITAELGIFYVQIIWYPVAILLAALGAAALGPAALVTLAILSTIFVAQPEEALMPFVVQGLKIAEGAKRMTGRIGAYSVLAFALALIAAVPFALWVDYNYGGTRTSPHDAYGQPRLPFSEVHNAKLRLAATDQLESSHSMAPLQRFREMRPKREFVWATATGLGLVFLTYIARLRWAWWPIHPVIFLVWDTWAASIFFYSFLFAWFIQVAVSNFGTAAAYGKARDFMIGVIAGELMGGMLWIIVGWMYYYGSGQAPPYYNIFPY